MTTNHLTAALEAIRNNAAAGVAGIDAAAEAIDASISDAAEAARQELAVAVSNAHRAVGAGHARAVEEAAHDARIRIDAAARQNPRPTQDRAGTLINATTIRAELADQDPTLAAAFDYAEPGLRDPVVEGVRERVGQEGCTLSEAIFSWTSEARAERRKKPGELLGDASTMRQRFRDQVGRESAEQEASEEASGDANQQHDRLLRHRNAREFDA